MAGEDTSKSPQQIIDAFWKANIGSTTPPDRPFSVLPDNVYAKIQRQRATKEPAQGVSVAQSYREAVKDCEEKVARIVAECRRNNVKYTDSHFDLDDAVYCLQGLSTGKPPPPPGPPGSESGAQGDDESDASSILIPIDVPIPPCAKRVGAIFEKPQFFIGGPPNVTDTRQGAEGDCWFLSSIGSLCVDDADRHPIERLCPPKARNEKVGVYGFVFYRDGEWISEIIDDKLFLACPDYDDCTDERRSVWDRSNNRIDPSLKRESFRKQFQTGSDALYFGSCSDPNETWVPLIEKAFAKAHGDYQAISGGFPGEGLEDLTGGITIRINSADILDIDELWTDGLMHVNKTFLFGVGSKCWAAEDFSDSGRQGIQDGHAYSVLQAREYKGIRLLQIKNPWGNSEWNGPWSDGSREWTPEALRDLDYTFGDDGIFWMKYEDFLRRFVQIWRTRLFTADWKVTQKWTTVQVPWAGDYNPTKFQFTLAEDSRVVIVLSKLDDRYFRGLAGQYFFDVSFRLHATGDEVHLIRGYGTGARSAEAELELEAGSYDVLMQISGIRNRYREKMEDVVAQNWLRRREKLIQVGLSYDLAQAKGQVERPVEAEEEEKNESESEPVVTPPTPPAEPTTPRAATFESEAKEGAGVGAESGDDPAPAPGPAPEPAPSIAPPQSEAPDTEAEDQPGPGAWNATLVVGLRVFCETSSAVISVVTPESEAAVLKAKEEVKLDVDDPEKDLAEAHSDVTADDSEAEIEDSQ